MQRRDRGALNGGSELESTLDALLTRQGDRGQTCPEAAEPATDISPIDKLRQIVSTRLLPLVGQISERYAEKGVTVAMDASDFLDGGRGLLIEIQYSDHRCRLEGTVTSDAIAFHETRLSVSGGTVIGGPMLRMRQLTDEAFGSFLYERIISLVKAANKTP